MQSIIIGMHNASLYVVLWQIMPVDNYYMWIRPNINPYWQLC